MSFRLRRFVESVEAFHHRSFEPDRRELWIPALDDHRTLVLGSSQDASTVDLARCAERGVEVARRRTGGGAVLVSVDDLVWFDLIIGRDDPLWTDDVGRAFEWVGVACAATLQEFGVETEMHTGRHLTTVHSPSICFAGLGAGELTTDGRKLVGISQRRTRTHARFQVAVLRRWSGPEHADLLAIQDAERTQLGIELDALATGIDVEPSAMIDAIHRALPN